MLWHRSSFRLSHLWVTLWSQDRVTFCNGGVCTFTFPHPTRGCQMKFALSLCYPVRRETELKSAAVRLVTCTQWRLHLWFSRWYLVSALPAISAECPALPGFSAGRHQRAFFIGMNFILDARLLQTATSHRVINSCQQNQEPKQSVCLVVLVPS